MPFRSRDPDNEMEGEEGSEEDSDDDSDDDSNSDDGSSKEGVDEEMDDDEESDDEDKDDMLIKMKKASRETNPDAKQAVAASSLGEEDSSGMVPGEDESLDMEVWLEEGGNNFIESLRDKFVTGNWDKEGGDDDDAEKFDDFQDLETGARFGPNSEGLSDDDDDEDGEDPTVG